MRHRISALGCVLLGLVVSGLPAAVSSPPKHSSCALALTPDGLSLLGVSRESGSLFQVDLGALEVKWEIFVGQGPVTLSISPDGKYAVTANRQGNSVSIVGLSTHEVLTVIPVDPAPWGVLFSHDGTRIFVACEHSGFVIVLDVETRRIISRILSGNRPAGLALTPDGHTLAISHVSDGSIDLIDTRELHLIRRIASFSTAELSPSVMISADGTRAYLPQTRSHHGNPSLGFDTTVFPVVAVIDLENTQLLKRESISLDTADRPVALPYDAALTGNDRLLIVNSASNDLSIIDLDTGAASAHVDVGSNPRAVVVSPDSNRAFVLNMLDATVSVIDTSTWSVTSTVDLDKAPLPPVLLEGKKLFFSSAGPELSRDNWISCNSCHWEGEMDGRTWQFSFSGPRNTTSLKGMIGTYPLRWSATWDESADSEAAIRLEQFGTGLMTGEFNPTSGSPNQGRSLELDSLGAYLDSLAPPSPPRLPPDHESLLEKGRKIFFDPSTGCSDCHPPPRYTDFETHDIGTADGSGEYLGPEIDTPSLLGLAYSAPYLHDGTAPTLESIIVEKNPLDRHGVTSHLDTVDIRALTTFLLYGPGAVERSPRQPAGRAETGAGKMVVSHSRSSYGMTSSLSGTVVWSDSGAPVPHALVSIRASGNSVTADATGNFTMAAPAEEVELTAWTPGAYIAGKKVTAPKNGISLQLRRLHTTDNRNYDWVDPRPEISGSSACGSCHPNLLTRWSANAHAHSVSNPRFFSLYNGENIDGSSIVESGYLRDFPDTAGSCAACHAPGAALDAPFSTNMNDVRDQLTAGIHCDFCHKTLSAYLRPATTAPYSNMPGVFSYKTLRPPPGDDVFFGPYPDIHDPDSYAAQMEDSRFCAPCHEHSFWGTQIYTSYSEWQASEYPSQGISCQNCHMPPSGDTHFAPPSVGGREHPSEEIPSHLQLGVTDTAFMTAAIDLEVNSTAENDRLHIDVRIRNTGAGHAYPTDHPGRHLLLDLEVTDSVGNRVALLDGPRIPAWAGALSGTPGTVFAKILRDASTGESPVVSYWKPTILDADTRIPAGGERSTSFDYSWDGQALQIRVRLRFRRLFEPIARRYGWDDGEIILKEVRDEIPAR